MTIAALLALSLLTATGQPEPNDQVMVVTGERISDLRANLEACLRRNCPPNEDIDATLALAEGEFLNGNYDRAEEWIGASLGRNRRHRRAYPEPVSDLYRSQALVQSHRGRDDVARLSTYEILRSLRAGIPVEDYRHFTARFEIVQMEMRTGDRDGVQRELAALIREAERAGRTDVVRRARMREMHFAYLLSPHGAAARRLEQLARSTDPAQQYEAVSARLFLAREYRVRGDVARADEMLASIPRSDSDTRALLYAPPIELTAALADHSAGGLLPSLERANFHNTWIDVAHWIRPDGTVEGVEIVRQGASAGWANPVLASIRGRRYAPSDDPTPSYRLERYTFTAAMGTRAGSRLMSRAGVARIEYLDLTARDEPGREAPVVITPGPCSGAQKPPFTVIV